MKALWRMLLSAVPKKIEKVFFKKYFEKEHRNMMINGATGYASNLKKQQALKEIGEAYQTITFVETGTYLGDTLYALYDYFERLYSIELSNDFHERAKKRFKRYNKLTLIQGDSGVALFNLVPILSSPSLFWLDGHYSGGATARGEKECPILEELTAIFASPIQHVIIIDDARVFVGKNDYPTVEEIKQFVENSKPGQYTITVTNDSIRILPRFIS